MSFIEQHNGRQTVFISELANPARIATLSVVPPRERVADCQWSDERFLVCTTIFTARKQHALVESSRLYTVDSLKGRVRVIPLQASVVDLTPQRRDHVLLQHDPTGRGFPEVVDFNVETGRSRVVIKSMPPVRSWMSDGRGHVRLGIGYESKLASVFTRASEEHAWHTFLEQDLSDPKAIGPLALGAESHDLFALQHHRGRAALIRMDLRERAASEILFSDPLYDVSGPVELHPKTRHLLAVRYQTDSHAVKVFDEEEAKLRRWIDEMLPAATNTISSRSLDDRVLLIASSADTDAPSIYWADSNRRRLELLGHQYPELEGKKLASMRALMYSARDGQRIPAYLTLPLNGTTPMRAVVLPHGGPETRDVKQFDPLVQFLAGHGFAVMQMNFRGSLGYGAGFAAAGAREWGGVMHNDITDAARWLVSERVADPEHICIAGMSFGGYAALLGAVRESQWYSCAMSFAAPTDLMALAQYVARGPHASMWRERLGRDLHALWHGSPLAHVERTETPTLVLHGLRDAVVPTSHGRRLARELERASKSHKYVERTDCDHDLTAESCRVVVFSEFRDFLQASNADLE